MTYKDAIIDAMTELAKDPLTVFVGYNVKFGSKAGGTLINVPEHQLIETPVAENLMAGMATGLSLHGFKPVIYFERFDFILNAMDSIVNHLSKMSIMSNGEFNPKAILRVVVGSRDAPLFTGPTHTQDLTEAMRKLVDFPIFNNPEMDPRQVYDHVSKLATSAVVIEHREKYSHELHQ